MGYWMHFTIGRAEPIGGICHIWAVVQATCSLFDRRRGTFVPRVKRCERSA
jgi:hypothetical protein